MNSAPNPHKRAGSPLASPYANSELAASSSSSSSSSASSSSSSAAAKRARIEISADFFCRRVPLELWLIVVEYLPVYSMCALFNAFPLVGAVKLPSVAIRGGGNHQSLLHNSLMQIALGRIEHLTRNAHRLWATMCLIEPELRLPFTSMYGVAVPLLPREWWVRRVLHGPSFGPFAQAVPPEAVAQLDVGPGALGARRNEMLVDSVVNAVTLLKSHTSRPSLSLPWVVLLRLNSLFSASYRCMLATWARQMHAFNRRWGVPYTVALEFDRFIGLPVRFHRAPIDTGLVPVDSSSTIADSALLSASGPPVSASAHAKVDHLCDALVCLHSFLLRYVAEDDTSVTWLTERVRLLLEDGGHQVHNWHEVLKWMSHGRTRSNWSLTTFTWGTRFVAGPTGRFALECEPSWNARLAFLRVSNSGMRALLVDPEAGWRDSLIMVALKGDEVSKRRRRRVRPRDVENRGISDPGCNTVVPGDHELELECAGDCPVCCTTGAPGREPLYQNALVTVHPRQQDRDFAPVTFVLERTVRVRDVLRRLVDHYPVLAHSGFDAHRAFVYNYVQRCWVFAPSWRITPEMRAVLDQPGAPQSKPLRLHFAPLYARF